MQVNLRWTAVPNALYYNVYRSTFSGGPYILIAQSNPNPGQNPTSTQVQTTYQDGPGNLPNGLPFYYVVSAVTVDGEAPYSAEYVANPPAQPGTTVLTGTVT